MFVQSAQIPTFQVISIFLQIQLDDSNYYIFPSCFAQMKWKSMGRADISMSAPYNFLHFSQQYTVHIMAQRKKSSRIFLCVRVRIRSSEFSPVICAYI